MTLADTHSAKPDGQGGMLSNLQSKAQTLADQGGRTLQNLRDTGQRTFQNLKDTGGRKLEQFARQPKLDIPFGKKKIHFETDRVRAAPAITPTLSGMIGQTATMLGLWGLLFPNAVKKTLGVSSPTPVVRTLFGLRELWSGYSLLGDPTRTDVLWTRVAADVADLAVLKSLDNPRNPQRGNARLALGFVLAVTALDAVTAYRMTNVKRNCD